MSSDEEEKEDAARLRSVSRGRSQGEPVILKNAEGTYDKFSMHYNTLSAGDDNQCPLAFDPSYESNNLGTISLHPLHLPPHQSK